MGDELLAGLLHTMGVAVFERRPDGAFVSVTEPPPWFSAMKSDATFPFLGHILSEATEFWDRHVVGAQDWGPCAEVDDHGKEFHYKVTAVQAEERQYLTFQLDRDSDRMREMLQKVRDKALAEGTRAKRTTAAASEARRTGTDLYDLLGRLRATGLSQAQNDIVAELTDVCDELLMSVERVARSSPRSGLSSDFGPVFVGPSSPAYVRAELQLGRRLLRS